MSEIPKDPKEFINSILVNLTGGECDFKKTIMNDMHKFIEFYMNSNSARLLNELTSIEMEHFTNEIDTILNNNDTHELILDSETSHHYGKREPDQNTMRLTLNKYMNHLENVCMYYNEGTLTKNHFINNYITILRMIKQNNILYEFKDNKRGPNLYINIQNAIKDVLD